jgi:hypothetical protein
LVELVEQVEWELRGHGNRMRSLGIITSEKKVMKVREEARAREGSTVMEGTGMQKAARSRRFRFGVEVRQDEKET